MTEQPNASGLTSKVKESIVAESVRTLKLSVLTEHLNTTKLDKDEIASLMDMVARASSLIMARVDPGREQRRAAFADGIEAYLTDRAGKDAAEAFRGVIAQLAIAEDGYRRILGALAKTEYMKLTAPERVAAMLSRAAREHELLGFETDRQIAKQAYKMPQSISLRDEFDRPISPDAVADAIVAIVGTTLTMEAMDEKWLQNEVVVVPGLPPVTDEHRFKAGSNERLAQAWRTWRRLEERARFLGGRLVAHSAPDLPIEAPDFVQRVYELQTPADTWHDFAAELRMNDASAQTMMEMIHERGIEDDVGDLDKGVALPPNQYVSTEEALALGALSETLGYAVKDDQARIEGIRILEWLRGMAVLSVLANRHLENPINGADPRLPIFEQQALCEALGRGGIEPDLATAFLDQVTYRRGSVDLFDAPLIQLADGRKLLFGPALLGTNHARILLSVFANREVAFEQKGKAFEGRVLELLKAEGLPARGFKVTRDGAEYEFDAVLPWGDYVFLFECKNRSLPGDRPVQQRHFAMEARAHTKQTLRLKGALEKWPDILTDEFGQLASGKQVVPCVLNNLPYARSGPNEGVYFFDFSALSRFFGSGTLNIKSVHNLGGGATLAQRTGTLRIWEGEKPSASDLLRQLEDPIQLRVLRHHTRTTANVFQLDESTGALSPEQLREDVTAMSLADMAGIPRRTVKLAIEKAARKAKKSRRRHARKFGGDGR